jgi:cellulose 1,4-beta-cellobiosidase
MDRRSWRRLAATVLAGTLAVTGLGLVAAPAHAAVACDVRYEVTSQWTGGFIARMTLRNLGSEAWPSWKVRFLFPGDQRVSVGWHGQFRQPQGSNEVTVTSEPYNATVPAGGQVSSIGFYGTYSGGNSPPTNFEVNGHWCFGGETVRPSVSLTALTVPEGSSAAFAVRLTAPPTTDATVTLNVSPDSGFRFAGGAIQTTWLFTPGSWNSLRWVSIFSNEDPDFHANTDTVFVHLGAELATVALTQHDNDDPNAPSLLYTPDATINNEVPENFAYRTFHVRLSRAPTTFPVTVTVSRLSGDPDLTATPTTLTFTEANWNTGAAVTLRAAEDADAVNGGTVFRLSPDQGIVSMDVQWIERDNDIQSIVVTPREVTIPEGGAASIRVKLQVPPPAGVVPVRVEFTSGDPDITWVSEPLEFTATNWNVDQFITLAAAEDPDTTSDTRTMNIISRSSMGILASTQVIAREIDND